MVSIVKRKKGNEYYYYLRHHVRRNNKQKEIYLGKTIPDKIDEIKQEFLLNFYKEEWLPILEKIHQGYMKERKTMPKSAIEKEIEEFSIHFTYNTQRIEGSTLTLKDTALLLEEGIAPANKPIRDIKEAEAHRKLFFEILDNINRVDLFLSTVLEWHRKLFKETKPDIAGKVRDRQVRIVVSKYVPPQPQVLRLFLKEFFEWYSKNKRNKKLNPVELAAHVHFKFVSIHPFVDGNGRISRLMMNYVLHKFGYPMLDIDYSDRRSYYRALERSNLKKNDVIFLEWFMKRYIKSNKRYIETSGPKITRKISLLS